MSTIHNLGLPASECAKLVSARPAPGEHPAVEDVASAAALDAAPSAPAARPRPANHLSGFARA
jgi:hypothetical protein